MSRILLFLFANNTFTYANYFMIAMLIYNFISFNNLELVKATKGLTFYLLIFSSVSFMVISEFNNYEISSSTFVLKFISPVCLFYIGYLRGTKGFNSWKKDIIVIMIATFIHGFLNVVTNRNTNVLLIEGRQYQDIYGGAISATLQNLLFVLSSALLFYFVVYEHNNKLRLIGIFTALAGSYGSIANASRTLLYVITFVFLECLFIHFILKSNLTVGIIQGAVVVCVILLVCYIITLIDLFGINEWLMNSALGQRETTASSSSSVSQNLRWGYSRDILRMIPMYPMGNIPYGHYAHNLWVDIAKESGIIPFVLYILYSISALIDLIKYVKKNKSNSANVVFVVSIFTAHILVFFTEPIMEGSPMTFSFFCFIIGGISAIVKDSKRSHVKTS